MHIKHTVCTDSVKKPIIYIYVPVVTIKVIPKQKLNSNRPRAQYPINKIYMYAFIAYYIFRLTIADARNKERQETKTKGSLSPTLSGIFHNIYIDMYLVIHVLCCIKEKYIPVYVLKNKN